MRTRRTPVTVEVFGCSTTVSLYDMDDSETWTFTRVAVTVDEAHTLVERPYVLIQADRFESPSWFRRSGDAIEIGWSVYALGLIEDDAEDAARQAVEALRADIRAGNIAKGAHRAWVPRDPLEPPVEAELRAYRAQVLRESEAKA